MTSRWLWLTIQVTRRIWFRASIFSVVAVLVALLGIALDPYIPSDLPAKVGANAVDHILSIIASSMLTVTTFSLSIMVSAYSAATTNVTPRATKLVIEDSTTKNVLSTFVGSFLFSLVGIIVLSTGAYGAQGRVVLFAATIIVIILIVVTLLRWIDHLARLGRVTETTDSVEQAAAKAMRARHQNPYMGGRPFDDPAGLPPDARAVPSSKIGYVQHVDIGALAELIPDEGGAIYLNAIPGKFVDPTQTLAWTSRVEGEAVEKAVRDCFSIADTRSFDQDPRFGASVLAEIASRALSPGINDPGTAIDVIGRAVRILSIWSEPDEFDEADYPEVYVPPLALADLFDDLFMPIARDGAPVVEIGLRLQKAFLTLSRLGEGRLRPQALRHAAEALERSESALPIEADKVRVRQAAQMVLQTGH
ncbi:hypothetical protein GCM10011321_09900 [Youhaiella tibetensis]|uniref:DUF2254 domain-containing protein n=1 Tax=Paradevosia tibetensis TaxID=1447062 RepID=A0A5B9DP83_9HYPH|nr:DUF2254 domain-containing protein [Youhaiella tibetensis]QEE20856.1 DUF2254 domain-containing protein [Youhaiella tibetensis]GGF20397.1 hypothetical protein GCM10011321_09900 [Youhaiella tibetensis]